MPVLHPDGTQTAKLDSWRDIVHHWMEGEPQLDLHIPLKDSPYHYYNGKSGRQFNTKYSQRCVIVTEFLDEFQGDEETLLKIYGSAIGQGHTKLLKAILAACKWYCGAGECHHCLTSEEVCDDSSVLQGVTVTPNDSEEDEQAVESTVQAEGDLVSENLVDHDGHQAVENMMDSVCHNDVEHESASDSDWSADQRCNLKCEQTLREICTGNYDTDNHPSTPPLPSPSSSEEEGAADTKGDTDSSVTRRCREAKGKSHALANTSSEDEDGPSDTGDLPDGLEMTGMHGKPKGQHHAFCKVVVTPSAPTLASDLSQFEDTSSAEAGLPYFKPGWLPLEAI
ncbi:hypothetical protein BKA82DRAFT_17486 [Pisolithus tinctorius]|nr:hypothetical protein BKA82DRAFT_17486 [Pisolithus tinctorius]